ncbi:twin-arginine translocase TatA/TatE family subunit [Serratia rubidaea]|uniref:twin-arginine translocase TatA/TatE family subunit n=1 Tax=Serratia rubidaea TaxID=61652 RepID=UPI00242EC306|nr:twin-arginine translocase TatA/TatE family subunit [Serratia rubidaea]MCR1000663.1 twin-arginine translocase TatA/TatE family subunit [Serratia rubidaea]
MGGISIWQLLIIAVLVVLSFGTKKLGSLGADLGESIKGFKKAMSDDDKKDNISPHVNNSISSLPEKTSEAENSTKNRV